MDKERKRFKRTTLRHMGSLAIALASMFMSPQDIQSQSFPDDTPPAITNFNNDGWRKYAQGGPKQEGNIASGPMSCASIVADYQGQGNVHAADIEEPEKNDYLVSETPSNNIRYYTDGVNSAENKEEEVTHTIGIGVIMPPEVIESAEKLGEPDPYQTIARAQALTNCAEAYENQPSRFVVQTVDVITPEEELIDGKDMCSIVNDVQKAVEGKENEWTEYVQELISKGADKIFIAYPSINDPDYKGWYGCAWITTENRVGVAFSSRVWDLEDWLTFTHELGHTLGLPHETWDKNDPKLLFPDTLAVQNFADPREYCRYIGAMSTEQGSDSYPWILYVFGKNGGTHRNPNCSDLPMGDENHDADTRIAELAKISAAFNQKHLPEPYYFIRPPNDLGDGTVDLRLITTPGQIVRYFDKNGEVVLVHADEKGVVNINGISKNDDEDDEGVGVAITFELGGVTYNAETGNIFNQFLPYVANR